MNTQRCTKIIDNDKYLIYGPTELLEHARDLNSLSNRLSESLNLFKIATFPQIKVNIFTDFDAYYDYEYETKKDNPYEINIFTIAEDMAKGLKKVNDQIIHDTILLLYRDGTQKLYEPKLWLAEGLAIYLSEQNVVLENDETRFRYWYFNNIIRRDREIPPFAYLQNKGNKYGEFCDDETFKYNGYYLSYLMIRYLHQTASLKQLLFDKKALECREKGIISKTIAYFNDHFKVTEVPKSFEQLKTPEDLMDYMNLFILYGWLDQKKGQHINTLEHMRRDYRISSLEEIQKYQIGTCIEQAKLIYTFLKTKGYQAKIFCHRQYEDQNNDFDKIKMHCFVIYKDGDKWIHFEHSNAQQRGIHIHDSLNEALQKITASFNRESIRVLTEIPDIPDGLTFGQFNIYVNSYPEYKF